MLPVMIASVVANFFIFFLCCLSLKMVYAQNVNVREKTKTENA